MNLRTYGVMMSILGCIAAAYLYNQENLPIQIALCVTFIVFVIASIIMLIRNRRTNFQLALKKIFESKSINVGSLIVLVAIFLSPFVSEYREILSYLFSATAAIILTANVVKFAKSRLKEKS